MYFISFRNVALGGPPVRRPEIDYRQKLSNFCSLKLPKIWVSDGAECVE
jgi:hypothetical protein